MHLHEKVAAAVAAARVVGQHAPARTAHHRGIGVPGVELTARMAEVAHALVCPLLPGFGKIQAHDSGARPLGWKWAHDAEERTRGLLQAG